MKQTNACAQCGKEGGNLNTCNKCEIAKYCNAACKKKHRSKHKKACERRAAELHDEALFKEHPPREECPICFLPLPLNTGESVFQSCCGKLICSGCIVAMMKETRGRGKKKDLCAFCREPSPSSEEDEVKRMKKLVDVGNAHACYNLAGYYATGDHGTPQDVTKANELYLRAGELGRAEGYCNLGFSYDKGRGMEMDKKKARHFYELAAMNGDIQGLILVY